MMMGFLRIENTIHFMGEFIIISVLFHGSFVAIQSERAERERERNEGNNLKEPFDSIGNTISSVVICVGFGHLVVFCFVFCAMPCVCFCGGALCSNKRDRQCVWLAIVVNDVRRE